MCIIRRYYKYNSMSDSEKGKFILELLKISNKQISLYQNKLNFFMKDDFYNDVMLEIINIVQNQKFKLEFNYTKEKLYFTILENEKMKKYYLNFIIDCYYSVSKNEKIYTKNFVFSIYEEYKNYTFLCKFKAYINKSVENIYHRYRIDKYNRYYKIEPLSSIIVNSYYVNNDNVLCMVDIYYLNCFERKLLSCFIKENKILTQCEVAKELGINNRKVSKEIINIRNKLKI